MKKNLFYFTLLMFIFSFATNVQAQKEERGNSKPVNKAEWTAKKLTAELMLDDKTAAKFVPLYVEYMKDVKDLHTKAFTKNADQKKPLTDAQRIEKLESRYKLQADVANLKIKYVKEFSKILTARQVEKVMKQPENKNNFGKRNGKKQPMMRGATERNFNKNQWNKFKGEKKPANVEKK